MRRIILILGLIIAETIFAQPIVAADHFDTLQAQLIKDGFKPNHIKMLYGSTRALFDVDTASYYFIQRESKMNYGQFLEDSAIKKAARYLERFNGIFTDIKERYSVPKEIIAAILLVETRLGRVTGSKSILNTLSTLAALDDQRNKNYLLSTLKKKQLKISQKRISKWANRKSKWAYKELKAYLTYAAQNNIDPLALRGSYAGALGFAQFLPSNVLRYGRDGNGDGRIDLFNHLDAIESIAYFLEGHGWEQNISRKNAEEVLFAYNRSIYYVDTILSVADKLRGGIVLSGSG